MRKRFLVSLGVVFALYVGAYLWLSRRGYSEAERYGMKGFHYISFRDSDAWRISNYGCVILFWPLNVLDRAIGFGRHPAYEPSMVQKHETVLSNQGAANRPPLGTSGSDLSVVVAANRAFLAAGR